MSKYPHTSISVARYTIIIATDGVCKLGHIPMQAGLVTIFVIRQHAKQKIKRLSV
jgi:hypothetical protein